MDLATKTVGLLGRDAATATATLLARDTATGTAAVTNGATELLKLLQNPFGDQLQIGSIWASMGTSFGVTAGVSLLFSLVRPYHTVVYAPKIKHADEQHTPPPLGKGIFAWIGPLWTTNEQDLIRLVGMDAALFMRFAIMCRNIFFILAVLGCAVLIPVNYTKSVRYGNDAWLTLMGPSNVFGQPQWAQVVLVWLSNLVICFFLWWNYRKVLQMRRAYFDSPDFQMSLHSRTLMLFDIPKKFGSDEGIARIIDQVAPNSSFSRTVIARNVKILPDLIKQHETTVRELEKVLAKYLKDPQNLPPARPMCYPSKKDRSYGTYPRGQKVDAIEYLTQRIKALELEIKEVRQSVDKRNTMSYGFASYSDISEAHSIAFAARKKRPLGASIRLAPRPNDIIWDNMPLSAATRGRRRFMNNLWIAALTFLWVAPNAMIAIFLVNLSNLGLVWPAFQKQLESNTRFWQLVQGVASPAVTSLVYLLLPIIFRRLAIGSGDQTKTGRERHVLAKLFNFFVFNNLIIFSLFSAVWGFVSAVIDKTHQGENGWHALVSENLGNSLLTGLCNISPYWITWLLQRELGVATDLAQLWPLFWGFVVRRFSSPTPRELIELTAPPTFDYASYYNYFLFYSTVALCFSGIQPLVLPAAAVYFIVDVILRKYMILYVFITKTESSGAFWRVLFNRFVFGTILSNLVVFLIVFVRGTSDHIQAYVVAPLPFLMLAFKFFCARAYDEKIHYYTTRNVLSSPEAGMDLASKENLRSDRLAARFGHPALYKPLTTPMVHAKAQNILASVYSGRLTAGREAGSGDAMSVSGYSDMYMLDPMNANHPGKAAASSSSSGGKTVMPGFEVVPESRLDFEYFKNREEFADEYGGGGDLYGTSRDLVRPGTPGSIISSAGGGSMSDFRPGTPLGGMTGRRQFSQSASGYMGAAASAYDVGTMYKPGYNKPGAGAVVSGAPRTQSPGPLMAAANRSASPGPLAALGSALDGARSRSPFYGAGDNSSASNLVGNAAPMPVNGPQHAGGFSSRDYDSRPTTPRQVSRGGGGGGWTPERLVGSNPRAPGGIYGGGGSSNNGGGGGIYNYGNLPQEDMVEQDPASYDYFRGRASRRATENNSNNYGNNGNNSNSNNNAPGYPNRGTTR